MSEVRDQIGRLHLVGYEKLTAHGLALPVFGRSLGANIFYTLYPRCLSVYEKLVGRSMADFTLASPRQLFKLGQGKS
jgi:hypothetical protein